MNAVRLGRWPAVLMWGLVVLSVEEGIGVRYLLPRSWNEHVWSIFTGDYLEQLTVLRDRFPGIEALHRVPGAVMLIIGLLQFRPRLRRDRPRLHRRLGRLFLVLGLATAASAVIISLVHPFVPVVEPGLVLPTALGLLIFMAKAWRAALRKHYAAHREWMIRTLGLSFFIAVQRLLFGPMVWFTDWSHRDAFVISVAWGIAIATISAECWVLKTRAATANPARTQPHQQEPIKGTPA